jgi:hypothetical protein
VWGGARTAANDGLAAEDVEEVLLEAEGRGEEEARWEEAVWHLGDQVPARGVDGPVEVRDEREAEVAAPERPHAVRGERGPHARAARPDVQDGQRGEDHRAQDDVAPRHPESRVSGGRARPRGGAHRSKSETAMDAGTASRRMIMKRIETHDSTETASPGGGAPSGSPYTVTIPRVWPIWMDG